MLAPAILGACSTVAASGPAAGSDQPPVRGQTPGHACTTEGTEQFVGQLQSDQTAEAIKQVSNAAILRWAPPGVAMTMDFRSDRVTVYLDASNKITKINCG